MEIGSIISYIGSTLPEGFLLCDGSAVSRDAYSDLFDIIGTSFGNGDGSTTFNLPNLVGRVAMGTSAGYSLASTGGEETHTLDATEVPAHAHEFPTHGHGNTIAVKTPVLKHTVTQAKFTYSVMNSGANHGGGNGGGFTCYNSNSNKSMSRSANVAMANHAAGNCTMGGSVGECAAFDTDVVGQDQAHSNMMPYLAVMYIIRYEPESKAERMLIFNGCMPVAPSGTYLKGKKR